MDRKTVIWWIRRDLRLHDNCALTQAVQRGKVIPLFILDPALLSSPCHSAAEKRKAFLWGGLRSLDADLRARGSRLFVREGAPQCVLAEVGGASGAACIFAEEDYSPYARKRDAAVSALLPLHLLPGASARHPSAVRKADGSPYTVFTPFSRAWKALPIPAGSEILPAPTGLG
jgi:deoxyribodipyrimidine photo-lyase